LKSSSISFQDDDDEGENLLEKEMDAINESSEFGGIRKLSLMDAEDGKSP